MAGSRWIRRVVLVYLIALLLFKCYLTFVAFTTDYPLFTSDAKEYLTIVRNLTTFGVYSSDLRPPFRHDVIRVPIYPAALALFGPRIVLVVQHILVVLSSLFLLRRGYKVEGITLFLSPTLSVFTNQNLTEGVYVPLLIFLLSYRGAFWGFLWGLMSLLRQSTLLLFPPILLITFYRDWKRVIVHLLTFLIPVVVWATVNYVKGHIFTLSSGFNTTLLVYLVGKFSNVSDVTSSYANFTYMGDWISVVNSKVTREILSHPVQSVFWWLWGSTLTLIKAVPRAYLQPFGRFWPIFYLLFYPYLAFVYLATTKDRRLILLWVFYILAVGPLGEPRLRLPLEVLTLSWPLLRWSRT